MKPKVPKDSNYIRTYYSNSIGNKFKRNLKIKENSSQYQFYAFAGFAQQTY